MSRIARTLANPEEPKSLAEYLSRVQQIVDGGLEFGSPQDPKDPASATLANGVAHNGTLVNVAGAWFEVAVAAADTKFDCAHNLGAPVATVAAVKQPNVRWLVFGFQHDGTGADAASTLSVNYETSDAASITTESFPLRLYAAGGRTVSADHPVKLTLFFTSGVR